MRPQGEALVKPGVSERTLVCDWGLSERTLLAYEQKVCSVAKNKKVITAGNPDCPRENPAGSSEKAVPVAEKFNSDRQSHWSLTYRPQGGTPLRAGSEGEGNTGFISE